MSDEGDGVEQEPMGVFHALSWPFRFCFELFWSCCEFWFSAFLQVLIFAMALLNSLMSAAIFFEEMFVVFLILPWSPTHRVGDILNYLRRWGITGHLTFTLYFTFAIVFVVLSIVALELHVLEVNDALQESFTDLRGNLFTTFKLFIVIHRLLNLLTNEASLRSSCRTLKKRLISLGYDVEEVKDDSDQTQDASSADEDYLAEVKQLRQELERTKNELGEAKSRISDLTGKNEATK